MISSTTRILLVDNYGDIKGATQIASTAVNNVPITIFSVGKIGTLTPNSLRYLLPNFCESTSSDFSAYVVPQDGNIDQLVCQLSVAPGAGEGVLIIVLVNGLMSSIGAQIIDSDIYNTDLLNAVDVSRGDLITVVSITSEFCVAENLQVMLRHNTDDAALAPPPPP